MSWRERFREDNELLFQIFGPWQRRIYFWAGVWTFIYQIPLRWPMCQGEVACGISMVKGMVWGAMWPVYWIMTWSFFR